MTDITAIGEILIDLTQTGTNDAGIPLFAANPGGAPANVAVAASRLGCSTAFIGKVGSDGFGNYLRQVLEENGVDNTGLHASTEPTTMAVVSVDGRGERSFQFIRSADCNITSEEVDDASLRNTKVLHLGSVSLTREPARSACLTAAEKAKKSGAVISYDPNYRAPLWGSREEAAIWMCTPLSMADIVKLSDEELPLITGTDDPVEGSLRLKEQGVSLVLVTMGEGGAFCRWGDETFSVPGVPVKVADTNGAGDTFLGAVLTKLCLRGERPLEGLSRSELEDILRYANRAAALTCSRSGAIPAMPTASELEGDR